jgi:MFS transporter, PAT family, beta-lactamase induction signal transducer AmpG
VWVGPLAGVLAESIGWPTFFVVSLVAGAPALALLWWMRSPIQALERPSTQAASAAAS